MAYTAYNSDASLAACSICVTPVDQRTDSPGLGYIQRVYGEIEFYAFALIESGQTRTLNPWMRFYNHESDFAQASRVAIESQTVYPQWEGPGGGSSESYSIEVPFLNQAGVYQPITVYFYGTDFTAASTISGLYGLAGAMGEANYELWVSGVSYYIRDEWTEADPEHDGGFYLAQYMSLMNRIEGDMAYKPGDSYTCEFCINRTAGAVDADASPPPVATANKNGTDDASTFALTVTKIDLGQYKVTGTVPATYESGDNVNITVAYSVSGVAFKEKIDKFLIDEKRVDEIITPDLSDLATILTDLDNIEDKVDIVDTNVDSIVDVISSLGTPPPETDVRDGVHYGIDSEGSLDLPAEADVKQGVLYDNETKEGTYVGVDENTTTTIEDL